MKAALRRWSVAAFAAGLLMVLSGCATGGYEGDVGVSYGVDYYEPYGYDYGHWHRGYHVAPPRGGHESHESRSNAPSRPSRPAYRPAPPTQAAPSIPSRRREH